MSYREINACRVCESPALEPVLNLGTQALTGVFPASAAEAVERAPLELVRCAGACGLVQLRHSCAPERLYGGDYGYRSGLNRSMVEHLRVKVSMLAEMAHLDPGDIVLDIGSNDGTSLSFYPASARLIGMDPTSAKFARYYPSHVHFVPEFFSARAFRDVAGGTQAKVITSIAMFYDLERPLAFMRDVHDSLRDDGLWHFEQSYLPTMLDRCSYDTICHEHLEYYGMTQIAWMAERAGFRLVDVRLNDVNGGSFAVTAMKGLGPHAPRVVEMIADESARRLNRGDGYEMFRSEVPAHRSELVALLDRLRAQGKRVIGLGASTKGNVILQYCGLGADVLSCIAEVNEDKFGRVTPGSHIPIVSETDALGTKPDYMLVLPWHFREGLLRAHKGFTAGGGRFIFPIPRVEIVPA